MAHNTVKILDLSLAHASQSGRGILKLGTVGALINTQLRGDALRHVLHVSTADVLLADHAMLPALRELLPLQGFVVFVAAAPEELVGTPGWMRRRTPASSQTPKGWSPSR